MSSPSDSSFSRRSLQRQNNGQPQPHRCDDCRRYCFAFEAHHYRLEPYLDSSTITVDFGQVRNSARYGCLFHQWLLTLLCGDEGPLPDLPLRGVVEIRISLKQVYRSEFMHLSTANEKLVPSKMSPNTFRESHKMQPFPRYAYQSACGPYDALFHTKLTLGGNVLLTGSGELSMCRAHNYSREMQDDTSCINKVTMIEWNKGSQSSRNFALDSLQKCLDSHPECQPLQHGDVGYSPQLPTRLVDVRSAMTTGFVRLVESATLATQASEILTPTHLNFAVLSYCWGGAQRVVLNDDTRDELLRGIRINHLGLTIQDAIQVCIGLKIPYLWVDALCIYQNNAEDKQHELAMMAQYYQQGVLTICAASAKSSTEGFLAPRQDNVHSIGPFRIRFEEGKGIRESDRLYAYGEDRKYVQKCPAHTEINLFKLHEERIVQPIAERAWTFQEAILSTRLLIFAANQVYWCCRERYVGCGGIHNTERISIVRPLLQGNMTRYGVCGMSLVRSIKPAELVPGVFTLANRSLMSTDAQWDLLVMQYSSRALTEYSDKLIAFAAAASYFDVLFRARWPALQYAAGLWYADESPTAFVRQLLWSSEEPATASRSPLYRAPTWSWAAIDGQVKQFDRAKMLDYNNPALRILRVSTELVSPALEFGSVSNAVLRLSGKVASLALFEGNGELSPDVSPVPGMRIMPDTKDDGMVIAANLSQMYILEVFPWTYTRNVFSRPYTVDSPAGIVLCLLSDPEEVVSLDVPTFKRMGSFVFTKGEDESLAAEIFENCLVEEMYIV